jgi:DNA-binding response OmpR family regulator
MSRSPGGAGESAAELIGDGAFVRVESAIPAREVSRRVLETSGADVLLLDARECRPSVTYRAIARIRSMGWSQGLVLVVDPAEVSMVAVASSIGASDFLVVGASPQEVETRLRQAARRVQVGFERRHPPQAGLRLHWPTHEVSYEGTRVAASHRELQLLSTLLERSGQVVTADDLARLAWGKQRGSGSVLAATYVCSLRKKLAWFGSRFGIQTVRGVGYRLVI